MRREEKSNSNDNFSCPWAILLLSTLMPERTQEESEILGRGMMPWQLYSGIGGFNWWW